MIGDSAYDSNKVYNEADDYFGAQLIAPPNPRNNQSLKGKLSRHTKLLLKLRNTPRDIGILLYHSKKGKLKYKKRIILEQTFDQIKYDIGLNFIPPYIKGIRKIREVTNRILLTFLSILYCNKLHRSNLLQIAPYVD